MQSIFENNRTALITGASSGIGLELAKALAPKLEALVLVARRLPRLRELAAELQAANPALKIVVEAANLAAPDAIQNLLDRLDALETEIDILVNNAGLGEFELFERSSWARIQEIVDVNVSALLRLSHHFLPGMVTRGHGVILNVGSGAGHAAMPNAAVYTASKHFVRAFSESLRAQLAGTGVIVSEVAPGPVDSEFDQAAGVSGAIMPGAQALRISARECAVEIVNGLERGSRVIFPGRRYRLLMSIQPLLPHRLLASQLAGAARKLRDQKS